MRLLPHHPPCFVCGRENPAGLQITFFRDDDLVVAFFEMPDGYSSFPGLAHGGALSSIIDEAMGRVVGSINHMLVVTGDLSVRFHQPLPVGCKVKAMASMDAKQRSQHRFWTASGQIVDVASGKVFISASGRFFAMPSERQAEALRALHMWGTDRAVTLEDL